MDFDLIIENGNVVDGTGKRPAYLADIGVTGDKITAIGSLTAADAKVRMDARGMVVSPGFIDVHVHSEIALIGGAGGRYGGVAQGVTTHFLAPDGFGWAPLNEKLAKELWEYTLFAYGDAPDITLGWDSPKDYLSAFEGQTPANVVPQVPHCAIRLATMGWKARHANDDELERMKVLTREWMDEGAVGLCVGLDYQPSASSSTNELIELSRVVHEYGGTYAAHIRYQELGKVEAWKETMRIGAESGVPVHISHESVDDVTGPLLEEAADRCDLTFESYLYRAGCTHLTLMLPLWAQSGGNEELVKRLSDPQARADMAAHLDRVLSLRAKAGGDAVISANQSGRDIGRSLMQLAEEKGENLGELALRMIDEEMPYCLVIFHHGGTPEEQEHIIENTIRHPRMLVASDGIYHGDLPHPRGFGCFSRILAHSVRKKGYITLEEAVYKMSCFPAERFGLTDRGRIEQGLAADLVVFDPHTVKDQATWDRPREAPVGVELVVVNGDIVMQGGQPTGHLPGRVVRRGG